MFFWCVWKKKTVFVALFYTTCKTTVKHSFTPALLSCVSICSMTFCSSRKLSSNFLSDRGLSSKIHSLKHHNYIKPNLYVVQCVFPGFNFIPMCYVIDFIDTKHTVHSFLKKTKLIYTFFLYKLSIFFKRVVLQFLLQQVHPFLKQNF